MANQPITTPSSSSSSSSSSSTPPRQALLQNLTTQSLLLTQLFSLLSSQSSTNQQPNGAEQIYAAIQLSTLDLSNLVRETYAHQDEWRELQSKKRQVELLEGRVRSLMKTLESGRIELEGLVEDGQVIKKSIEQSEKNPVHAATLLSHAHSLARHSSAPISSLMADVDKAQYQPWPTEMSMRMGLLFQMSGEGMGGMGQKGTVGEETKATAETVEQPQPTIIHEEPSRRYDPNAVFTLDLNSDDSDDD
ncbi:uncharacterized protein IL334_006065 [Kwoniella shivajii]|uniref:Mediator of RNA polymerase II transcription subunit 4 n=1 Tax=Kwoniella shivajii TaxID=564305 RepID=A0ABZ1D4W5_9TREE|nr:hypothetical protein IL334_006065 [Kwoniella shivajii]